MNMNAINTDGNIDLNMGPNPEEDRRVFEMQKYGRRMQQELAAHPHVYTKHSIPIPYGQFSEPSQEIV
jgi:hypothetical protein